jgi:hypothetical protein
LLAVTGLSLTFTGSFFGCSTGLTAEAHEGVESALTSSFLSDISLDFPHPHCAGYSSSTGFPQAGCSSVTLAFTGCFSSTIFPQTDSYLAGGFSFFLGASFSATALTSFYGSGAFGLLTSTLLFLGSIGVGLIASLASSSDFPHPCRSIGGCEFTLEGALVLVGAVVVGGACCFAMVCDASFV